MSSILAACLLVVSPAAVFSQTFKSPEILVLGDSQLSFGAGKEMLKFFKNFSSRCKGIVRDKAILNKVEQAKTTLLGVRSTSLHSWISTGGSSWNQMCLKDKKWGVNSSVWGHLKPNKKTYVQIGEGRNFQFCKRGKTPLQALFSKDYYKPKLVLFNLLGNGSSRWANSYEKAKADVGTLIGQLPSDVACVYMTTMPNYTKFRNDERLKAQANIERAFSENGARCSFVRGLTPKTVGAFQGNKSYFRRRKSGEVKDPFHPGMPATRNFLSQRRADICRAVANELSMTKMYAERPAGASLTK